MTELPVFPLLYKRRTDGSIHTWCMEVHGSSYRTIAGLLNGKLVASKWTVAYGKNEGKANATTDSEQAILEVEAKYRAKVKAGYRETLHSVDEDRGFFAPMLAGKYEYKRIDGQIVFIQPKLDGVRCIATQNRLQSRTGKFDFRSVPHIAEALKPIFAVYPDLVIDGELYNHVLREDFNKIISLVKKQDPTFIDLAESADLVQYHVYDCYDPHNPDLTFSERYKLIEAAIVDLANTHLIYPVKTTTVLPLKPATDEYIDSMLSENIAAGYEGQIIRLDTPYENKRTNNLLKHKEFQDAEFTVIAVEVGKGNRGDIAGFIHLELGDGTGRTFRAGIKGTHEFCRDLLAQADKYKGGQATIKYFNLTPDGIPRFPVCVAIYEGKRDV